MKKYFTITDAIYPNSPGTPNAYCSEADYWHPDPGTPDGLPYCRIDGVSNSKAFNTHRKLMFKMSEYISNLALTCMINRLNPQKAREAVEQLLCWFITPATGMEPHLNYAQAIRGICTGRAIGIIDTLHLCETALAIIVFRKNSILKDNEYSMLRRWFEKYLDWLQNSDFGKLERSQANNHSSCWYLQTAAFALLTDSQEVLEMCRNDFKNVLLPKQMAPDGSFPYELKRTKPYCYSIFNLEVLTALCQLLSTPDDNLFKYQTSESVSLKTGLDFLYPYLKNKKDWPYDRDIAHWESWPNKQACLFFAGHALKEKKYLELYDKMPLLHRDFEAVRNTPVKNPELWMMKNFNFGS
jgi:hypothetical protein